MKATPQTEIDLVRDLKAKRSTAFTALYDAYSPALFGVLMQLVQDRARAEDLLQDSFIRIWSNIQQYDPSHGRLFTWLLTITRNVALTELKARKTRLSAANYLSKQADAPSRMAFPEGTLHQSMLTHLAPKHRQVVELVYYRDYTKQEVADELHLPLGTVKTRFRMALQQLKQQFSRDIYQYHIGG